MTLNFNQCLILWALVFFACLVVCRCLIGVANRFLLGIDRARELMGGAAGKKTSPMDLIMEVARPLAGVLGTKLKDQLLGGKPG